MRMSFSTRRRRPNCTGPVLARMARPASSVLFLLMLGAAGVLWCNYGHTYGFLVSRHGTGSVQFRSLSSDAIVTDAGSINLEELTAGQFVDWPDVAQIRNTSGRPLPLAVELVGVPGLVASLTPAVVEPEGSASIAVSGEAGVPGEIDGYLRIAAFDGFLYQEIPLRGVVQPPPEPTVTEALYTPTVTQVLPDPALIQPVPMVEDPDPGAVGRGEAVHSDEISAGSAPDVPATHEEVDG